MIKKIKITNTELYYLSKGKVYEIRHEFSDHFVIKDDDGDFHTIAKVGDYFVEFEYVHEEEECTKPSGFSKKDLVAGKHIVVCEDGSVGVVLEVYGELMVLFSENNCMGLHDQEEDLSYPDQPKYSIVEVYVICSTHIRDLFVLHHHELVWQKNSKKKMTLKEIEEALGYSVEITD